MINIKATISKKGALELSAGAIIILILAIVFLGLALGFVKGTFGKTSVKLDELISREPEPIAPDADNPISLSRENIKTNGGDTEIIKIAVLNPTSIDWTKRMDLWGGLNGCGASDNICYIASTCDGTSDQDCGANANRACGLQDGVCLVDKTLGDIEDSDNNFYKCPAGASQEQIDCGAQDGIDLLIKCDNELSINKRSLPKIILSGNIETFTSVLSIKKGAKGRYLCEIEVYGHDNDLNPIEGLKKDLIIEVE